jgi:homocysteine S-methyltransferase
MEVLAEAGADALALETVPDAREAEALLRALDGLGIPAWLSFSVDGERTRAGQPLAEAFAMAAGVDAVIAVGVNCCDPQDVEQAVAVAAGTTGKPVVVYPNSGETWNAQSRAWEGAAHFDSHQVDGWVKAGARLVGGCCRVGPDAISAVAESLQHR